MIIDVSTSLGHWPFQRLAIRSADALSAHLAGHGIASAWVSAVESVLYPDPDVPDAELFEQLQGSASLHVVKTVNPTLANWRASLDEWITGRGVRAVKALPNYHGYSLADAMARDLAAAVHDAGLPLFVQMRIDDERNQYPLMQVPGVPYGELMEFARAMPGLTVIALCAYFAEVRELADSPANLYVDTSFVETENTLRTVLDFVPADRILFGSHTPFFTTRSGMMKLELADISGADREQIASANALRILGE